MKNDSKNIFYFFDGTGVNINSSSEEKYGKSVVGELFELNKSQHGFIEVKEIKGNLDGQTMLTNVSLENQIPRFDKNIKFYFPGPGADPCVYEGKLYDMPGREHVKISLKNIKSYRFSILNQVYGNGWEHNVSKALICAASLSYSKSDCHFIIGYSRGGITAISFSKDLSELRPDNKIYLFLIDPVAGGDYSIKCKINRYNKNDINPYFVGKCVGHVEAFYACTESRAVFEPQFPLIDGYLNYKRPLYFHKDTSANIYFLYADHQQIAYRKYINLNKDHAAGNRVFNEIAGFINSRVMPFQLYNPKDSNYNFTNYDYPYPTSTLLYAKKPRKIISEVSKTVGYKIKSFSEGVLFKNSPFI